ncbi:MAG TPA: HAMP domain-containing sensor histidine kinase [Gemmatimonadaceae bacterium]|jgi:signal transduction histidine kinase|nr:HAMP domain-containing sensor histidine kinase [Gemmatimonadaceae bacterium]
MSDNYQDYAPSQSSGNRTTPRRSEGDPSQPFAPRKSPSSLLRALELAADHTATAIAHGTKQARVEVRERLNEVINWLSMSLHANSQAPAPVPPVIAREYVSSLKVNFLAELATTPDLNANEVVRALLKLDEAEDAWRRTDRGKFISRLTGSDCADAVVAIAHDIRSPLCSILLLVDALRHGERSMPNPVRERQLGLIYGAAFGLSTTVTNLIAAARGDGLVQGKPTPFSVSETMHSVSSIVQPMCEEKGIPLGMEFPENDARLGYASAVQQALLNLTSNALRYTDAGSVAMGCSEVSQERVEFWVEDTGPGIPDDVLERLCYGFPPEGVKLRFSSAGLGLAIVRTLVEAMGSTLQVDSGTDGTRFSFVLTLPILQ